MEINGREYECSCKLRKNWVISVGLRGDQYMMGYMGGQASCEQHTKCSEIRAHTTYSTACSLRWLLCEKEKCCHVNLTFWEIGLSLWCFIAWLLTQMLVFLLWQFDSLGVAAKFNRTIRRLSGWFNQRSFVYCPATCLLIHRSTLFNGLWLSEDSPPTLASWMTASCAFGWRNLCHLSINRSNFG